MADEATDTALRDKWNILLAPPDIPYIDIMEVDGATPVVSHVRAWLEDALRIVYKTLNEMSLNGMPEPQLARLAQLSMFLQNKDRLTFAWMDGCSELDLNEIHERSLGSVIALDWSMFIPRAWAHYYPGNTRTIAPLLENFLLQALLIIAIYTEEPDRIDDEQMDELIDDIAFWFFPFMD